MRAAYATAPARVASNTSTGVLTLGGARRVACRSFFDKRIAIILARSPDVIDTSHGTQLHSEPNASLAIGPIEGNQSSNFPFEN